MSRNLCPGLSTESNSPGILCPFNASSNRSPRPSVLREGFLTTIRKQSSVCASWSHPASYGAALRLSQPLSEFRLQILTSLFSCWIHPWVFTLQSFSLFCRYTISSIGITLLMLPLPFSKLKRLFLVSPRFNGFQHVATFSEEPMT